MKPKIMLLWKHEWVCVSKDEVRGWGNTPTSAYRDWCIASARHRKSRRGAVFIGGLPCVRDERTKAERIKGLVFSHTFVELVGMLALGVMIGVGMLK